MLHTLVLAVLLPLSVLRYCWKTLLDRPLFSIALVEYYFVPYFLLPYKYIFIR